jgi:arginine-tRNA-protein transferase
VYLPSQTARLPLRLPIHPLSRVQLAQRLREGDRRQGVFLYRPSCPTCRACQAIRLDVHAFRPSKTQRRIYRRCQAAFACEIGRPSLTEEGVQLYNRHKLERNLLVAGELLDARSYHDFLVETCTDSLEICYRHGDRLVGVAIMDRASDALSAVYFYFDPEYAKWSPGVYSILKQVDLCRAWKLPYLYLGLYIADCRPMTYKAAYYPHERLISGEWRRFERPSQSQVTSNED